MENWFNNLSKTCQARQPPWFIKYTKSSQPSKYFPRVGQPFPTFWSSGLNTESCACYGSALLLAYTLRPLSLFLRIDGMTPIPDFTHGSLQLPQHKLTSCLLLLAQNPIVGFYSSLPLLWHSSGNIGTNSCFLCSHDLNRRACFSLKGIPSWSEKTLHMWARSGSDSHTQDSVSSFSVTLTKKPEISDLR